MMLLQATITCVCCSLQAMLEHGAVAEAAVIPVPDPLKGHVPLGFYVLKSGILLLNDLDSGVMNILFFIELNLFNINIYTLYKVQQCIRYLN